MTETKQFSIWNIPETDEQKKYNDDDNNEDERNQRRFKDCRSAFQKCCCCPCSLPVLIGFLIGALLAGIVLATILAMYLVDSSKTTTYSTTIVVKETNTLTTSTTSTVSTSTATTSTSVTTSSSSSSTSSTSTLTTSSTSTSTTSSTSESTSTSSTSSSSSSSSTSTSTTTSVTTTTPTTATSTTASTTTSVTTTSSTSTTTTAPYCTTRVTFDDIPGQSATSGIVPNGYQNFNWTNVFYLNASTMSTSGYQTVVSSSPFVGYNPSGATVKITTANGTRFAFDSVIISAAWRDDLTWSIHGYRAGNYLIYGTFPIRVFNRTTISCGSCSDLDTLYFTVSGGTPRPGLAENGTEFAFDDLCVSFGY